MRSYYTPKHMRRKRNASRNGSVGPEKTKAFAKAKQLSDRFIHQSASTLAKPSMAADYRAYCDKCDRGTLRGGAG